MQLNSRLLNDASRTQLCSVATLIICIFNFLCIEVAAERADGLDHASDCGASQAREESCRKPTIRSGAEYDKFIALSTQRE